MPVEELNIISFIACHVISIFYTFSEKCQRFKMTNDKINKLQQYELEVECIMLLIKDFNHLYVLCDFSFVLSVAYKDCVLLRQYHY